jgi:hypothetical protein
MTLRIVTLCASSNLLDKSDSELRQSLRFHAKFPESATETRVLVCELILEARNLRRAGGERNRQIAERHEAQVFACLFYVNDDIHSACNGSPLYKAALRTHENEYPAP